MIHTHGSFRLSELLGDVLVTEKFSETVAVGKLECLFQIVKKKMGPYNSVALGPLWSQCLC